ncbi:MAG: hypothetical protein ACKO9Q_11000, partial [Pirellula sp.]
MNPNPALIDLRDTLIGTRNLSVLIANKVDFRTWLDGSGIAMTEAQRKFLDQDWSSKFHSGMVKWFDSFPADVQLRIGRWSIERFFGSELARDPKFAILLDRPSSGAALYSII